MENIDSTQAENLEETQVVTLRVEKRIVKKIDEIAKKNRRSRSQEIIKMIEAYFKFREAE